MCKKLLFISFISLLVFISSVSAAPLISDADLVVYYGYDSVGVTVADGSGKGNDANVVGNVDGYSWGRSGADVVFGATVNDLLRFSAAPADRPSSAVTVATWCKIANSEADMSVFNVNGIRSNDPAQVANLYHMEIHPGTGKERIRWCVRNQEQGTIGTFYYYPPNGVITEEWFHFACTYDKNATDGQHLKMYINGKFVAGMAADAGLADLNIGTGWEYGAAIGTTANNARPFDGQMDEFYLFKRALTPAEISMLASASWLTNGGFETGDLTGWFGWNDSSSPGTYEVITTPASVGQGNYSAQITGGQQCGIAQIVAIPAGTMVQVDALWSGTCTVGNYWSEVKVLTHAPGASYSLNESYGDWKYVAKSDAWGLNTKSGGTWVWENAVTGSPLDGNTIISQGEVIVTTKIGGAEGNIMAIDNVAVTPLYSIVKASKPIPGDTGTVLVVDFDEVILRWDAGSQAASHDVYLGTDFDSVNEATTASAEFMGNQIADTYAPTIAAEGTYFWRIDEVNDIDIWKGDVWSFEVNQIPPPAIDDPIVWYPFEEGAGDVTADVSGNGNDANLSLANRWNSQGYDGSGCLTNAFDWGSFYGEVPAAAFADVNEALTISFWFYTEPICELYSFGAFCRADRANKAVLTTSIYDGGAWNNNPVWNYDTYVENYNASAHYIVSHMGAPEVGTGTTQWWYGYNAYAVNQLEQWHHLTITKDCESLVQKVFFDGQEEANYACDPTHKMNGITAFRFFTRSTTTNDWWDPYHGRMDDFRIYDRALSAEDVKLFVGDRFKYAWKPSPVDVAQAIALTGTTLSWQPGQKAVSHQVYYGDDRIEVKNADTSSACYKGEQTGTTYDTGALELMKTYYWRIDEVDSDGILWKGNIWSFSSQPSIMVEDFESYDAEGNDIAAVWTEKVGDLTTQISLQNDPYLSPINSMKLRYHVPYSPYYAIAGRSFSPAQNWTVYGVKILTINYYGTTTNFGLPAFISVGDGTTTAKIYIADFDSKIAGWGQMNVNLLEAAAAGVDLTKVSYLEIGFGDGTNKGMSYSKWDTIFVDDIALYPAKCVLSESSLQADITQDCVVNYDDMAYVTDGWLRGSSSAETIAAANPVGLWLFDDSANLTKATIGKNLTVGNYDGTGLPLSAVAGMAAGDGAVLVPLSTYLIVDPNFAPAPGETRRNEYSMVWDVYIPAASAYAPMRWVALCEFDVVDLTTDADIYVHYWTGDRINGVFGTHQGISAQIVAPDKWYQLAVSVKNGEFFNCYVNGEFVVSTPIQPIDGRYSIANTFHIFKDNDGEDPDTNCSTFALFNRALTAAEIKALVPVQLLKGDVNADTAIDFADYSILANEWLVEDLWP